jgi:hypothetical protein
MDHFNQGLDGATALFVRSVVVGLVLIVRRDNVLYVTYQPVVLGRGIATVRRQPATGILEIVGAPVDFIEGNTLRLERVGYHVPATYTHGNPVHFVDDFVPLPGDVSIVYLIGEGVAPTRTGISFSGGAIRININNSLDVVDDVEWFSDVTRNEIRAIMFRFMVGAALGAFPYLGFFLQ